MDMGFNRCKLKFDAAMERCAPHPSRLSAYEAGRARLCEDRLISVLLGEGSAFEGRSSGGASYVSAGEGRRLLLRDSGYGLGETNELRAYGFQYMDMRGCCQRRQDIEHFFNSAPCSSSENERVKAACSARQLDFMPMQDAIDMAMSKLNAMGIDGVAVEYHYGVTVDVARRSDGVLDDVRARSREGGSHQAPGQGASYYELIFRQTMDGVPISSHGYANRDDPREYHTADTFVRAVIEEPCMSMLSGTELLAPERAGEPMPVVSYEQAFEQVRRHYAGKFRAYDNVLAEAELVYHKVKLRERDRFRLIPAWAFTIMAIAPYGRDINYYEFCMIDAHTGEMYIAP